MSNADAPPPITDGAALAQRDAALDALAALVRYVRKIGGYATPEQQWAVWRAEAVLVENGRKI